MRWKQFFTPVQSVSTSDARRLLSDEEPVQLIDVRQRREYRDGHISGATLIPLGELTDHLASLDPAKTTIVYCAVGGRSRAAAQLLSGQGFHNVLNLTGGFKAWNGWTGIGDFEQGLHYFEEQATAGDVLAVAYGMEKALGDFYTQQAPKVKNPDAAALFTRLAAIESAHSHTVATRYTAATGGKTVADLEEDVSPEGGMTTQEYMDRLGTDPESVQDVIAFAMALEAQAMDLYLRAAQHAENAEARAALKRIAEEERGHLAYLATVMDTLEEDAS